MKPTLLTLVALVILASAVVLRANAQIVYTQVNISIPVGGPYNLDLNEDGITDLR